MMLPKIPQLCDPHTKMMHRFSAPESRSLILSRCSQHARETSPQCFLQSKTTACGVLRLPAGTLETQDQVACHGECQATPHIHDAHRSAFPVPQKSADHFTPMAART